MTIRLVVRKLLEAVETRTEGHIILSLFIRKCSIEARIYVRSLTRPNVINNWVSKPLVIYMRTRV